MKKDEYLKYIEGNSNKYLEMMAQEEHRLWREFYEHNDWHYNADRDDYKKTHNCLVEYKDPRLSEEDKDKDRDQIRKYWDFLDRVEFGIIKE
jgi:hypothetical protein